MWKTGTLSYEEFENDLLDFIKRSKNIQDSWNLEFAKGKSTVKYLIKHQVKVAVSCGEGSEDENEKASTVEKSWGVEDHNDDCAVSGHLPSGLKREFLKYEYHIIYSNSYSVPVLYFTASKQDGKLISLEEVWANVPDAYRERLQYEKWTFLTQQEHPYLGVPFYQLHPCHTADMMKRASSVLSDRPGNYLVTWLSTVGPVVGLDIPIAYSM